MAFNTPVVPNWRNKKAREGYSRAVLSHYRLGSRDDDETVERASDYFLAPRIASLAALATRNFRTFFFGIVISWPAFSPKRMIILRDGRSTRTSLPMPGRTKVFFACLYARFATAS